MYDVAVVGMGPAGRALAHRCADRGPDVLALDPDPAAPWRRTLALWADQVPGFLPDDVVAARVDSPVLVARGAHHLSRPYVILDNDRLQAALTLDGARVEQDTVDDGDLSGLGRRARVVIDCRGARPRRRGPAPLQVAYGLVLDGSDAEAALGGNPAFFMDWRDDYSSAGDAPHSEYPSPGEPSFLYAMPLGGGRWMLEETLLATDRYDDPAVLKGRLVSRLSRRGVPARALEEATADPERVELVRIPLVTESPNTGANLHAFGTGTIHAFGVAGGYGHAATGYSVGATLVAVDHAVDALVAGASLPAPRPAATTALHRVGLHALLGLGGDATVDLFDAFGRVPTVRQSDFVDSDRPPARVLAAMTAMWWRMPPRSKARMVRAALRP